MTARSTAPLEPEVPRERATLAVIRAGLLAIFVLGSIGILGELLLIDHVEDPWQRVPIFLIIASVVILVWHGFERRPLSLRFFQGTLVLFVLAGGLGLLLHFRGNLEFELENLPPLTGWPLVWAALRGATPTLAPGAMMQLGLIGLAYTFRHPVLRGEPQPRTGAPEG